MDYSPVVFLKKVPQKTSHKMDIAGKPISNGVQWYWFELHSMFYCRVTIMFLHETSYLCTY